MMELRIRDILCEVKNGAMNRKIWLIPLILLIPFYTVLKLSIETGYSASMMDLLSAVFSGVEIMQKRSMYEEVSIPIGWFLAVSICLYVNLESVGKPVRRFEIQKMIRSRNKKEWFQRKLVTILSRTIQIFVVVILSGAVAWLLLYGKTYGGAPMLHPSEITRILYKLTEGDISLGTLEIWLAAMVGPWLTILALSCLQLVLCLYIPSILSYVLMCLIVGMAAYFPRPWFVGSGTMGMRSSLIFPDGISFLWMSISCVMLVLVCFIIGTWNAGKLDVM